VAERVRRHALTLVHAGCVDVVAEGLAELGVVEPVALHADEDGLLGERDTGRVVLGEERGERGMNRNRPLPAALRAPNAQEPVGEVDVVPVEPEQLAPSQPCVGQQYEQQPVAFRLPGEVSFPSSSRPGCTSSRSSSPIVSTSGSASRFFGVRSGKAGSRMSRSSSTRKRKNDFSAAVVRAWLETAGRRFCSSARKARRCVTFTSARSSIP
jgi:hypothetical protein